jgi:hypothetical protein
MGLSSYAGIPARIVVTIVLTSPTLVGCAAPAQQSAPVAITPSELARATSGYRKVERDGRRVWCREEKATGVLMARLRCLTEAQLLEQERAAGRLRDRLSRPEACALEGCGRKEQ